MSKKSIGIFAGSFDPIHEGHLAFAKEALQQCNLDKVFFLVEPRPRRKQGVKALEHRQQMVQLAIKDDSQLGSIMLAQEQFSVTETMPVLQARFKGAELYVLMGDDVLGHLIDWPHLEQLASSTCFAIGLRNYSPTRVKKHIQTIEKTRAIKFTYSLFEVPELSLSSSVIRQAFKKGKEPTGLPPKVRDYIQEHQLYSSGVGA